MTDAEKQRAVTDAFGLDANGRMPTEPGAVAKRAELMKQKEGQRGGGSAADSPAPAMTIPTTDSLREALILARKTLAVAINSAWEGSTDDDVAEHLVIKRIDAAIAANPTPPPEPLTVEFIDKHIGPDEDDREADQGGETVTPTSTH